MRNLAVIGTGYVGLVTGVCLAEIGHTVTCVDVDQHKVKQLKSGVSTIYEPGLETLIADLQRKRRLHFTTSIQEALHDAEAAFIAVGTPQRVDGSADLSYVRKAAQDIGDSLEHDCTIIVKSTVPVGTNEMVKHIVSTRQPSHRRIDIVSNPEFLREGSALDDMFNADRFVIGSDNTHTASFMDELYESFSCPILHTDIRSAELIKYSSNAFLATKISFINEISLICEKLGADIETVAQGMGMDSRIGPQFLKAGIGYGGSCFPKDTKALVQIAGHVEHDFDLLKSVIQVNNRQQAFLVENLTKRFGSIKGKRVAVLGLAFKPNTDDIREAASIVMIRRLLESEAKVVAYDPVAMDNARRMVPDIMYAKSVREALTNADAVMIVTEWREFLDLPLPLFAKLMKNPVVFDGRNCFQLEDARRHGIEYYSIGRPPVFKRNDSLKMNMVD